MLIQNKDLNTLELAKMTRTMSKQESKCPYQELLKFNMLRNNRFYYLPSSHHFWGAKTAYKELNLCFLIKKMSCKPITLKKL